MQKQLADSQSTSQLASFRDHKTIADLQKQLADSNSKLTELADKEVPNLIQKKPKACQFYTGLNSFEKLWMMFTWLVQFVPKESRRCKLTYIDQFVVTLMKLRLNMPLQDLAFRFGIALQSSSKYFHFWLHAMCVCFPPALIKWPSRENLRTSIPLCFRDKFSSCVCIIDCFEIFLERPIKLKERASTYSSYKSHNTVKFLIGITPQGYVSFVSKGYGGRSSDKFIVEDSNFLENLDFGDIVLADRGFTVHESVSLRNAELRIPSFLGKRNQLTRLEVEESRELARIRVHVERVIGAIKQRFSVLEGPLPHECLAVSDSDDDDDALAVIDKMVRVSCALYNSCPSVVPLA